MDNRKRGRAEFFDDTGSKKSKISISEMGYLSSDIGIRSKPCARFFSVAGCPYGDNCHYYHYVPGGYNAAAEALNLHPCPPSPASGAVKTRICSKFQSGYCKFGSTCHFAHGPWELGERTVPFHDEPGHISGRMDRPAASSLGVTATAKISVDASLTGTVIGKGGENTKLISRKTGARVWVREHETDPNLGNVELEGSLEQVHEAIAMVRELMVRIGPVSAGKSFAGSKLKTTLCDHFAKGWCKFGESCHFAHGAAELRKLG